MDTTRYNRVVWMTMVVAALSMVATAGLETRTLHFPTDRSLGKVLVCEPVPDEPLEGFFYWIRGEDWKYLADARGDVAVPAGRWVSLKDERREAWSDLSPLRNLQPDDLYQLGIHGWSTGGAKRGDACMQHVAHLTGLRVLDLSQTSITGVGMKWIAGLQNLRRLTAPNRMDDAGLAHVAGLPALTALYLQETHVTDAGLEHLAGLQTLEELALAGGRITNTGLAHLAHLPRLRYLMLKGDGFSDAGFVQLKNVPSLRILHFGHLPQTTDVGLAHLSTLTQVQDLSFHWSENITNEGIRHLARLPDLRSLDVGNSKVTDEGLAYLEETKTLESLDLPSQGISDQGLAYLSELPRLRRLNISRVHLVDPSKDHGYYTDKGVAMLTQCHSLEELNIGSIGVTDASMESIAKLDKLRELSLFGCTAVTDEGLKKLACLKNLEILSVHDANTTISGLSCLSGLPNLRELRVDGVEQDYTGLDLSGLKKLEYVTIGTRRDGGVIGDADVACLAGLTQLKWFQIRNPAIRPPSLTDQGLASLAGLTQMDRLTIGGPNLTDEGLAHLRQMKRLDMLNIYGGRFTDQGLKHLECLDALTYLTLIGEHSFSQDDIRRLFEALPHLHTAQIGPKPPGQTYLRDKVLSGARRSPGQGG